MLQASAIMMLHRDWPPIGPTHCANSPLFPYAMATHAVLSSPRWDLTRTGYSIPVFNSRLTLKGNGTGYNSLSLSSMDIIFHPRLAAKYGGGRRSAATGL